MAEEGKLRDKIIRAFGLEDIDDDYDDETEETFYPEEEASQTIISQDTTNIINNPTPTPVQERIPDVLVLDPTTFNEAPGIVKRLKQNRTIVVNLKSIDFDEGRKIFDFLSGAVYALEGSLNRIDESVFILAPKQISVGTNLHSDQSNATQSSQTDSSTNVPSWDNN